MVQNEISQREYMKYDKNSEDGNVQSNIFCGQQKKFRQ